VVVAVAIVGPERLRVGPARVVATVAGRVSETATQPIARVVAVVELEPRELTVGRLMPVVVALVFLWILRVRRLVTRAVAVAVVPFQVPVALVVAQRITLAVLMVVVVVALVGMERLALVVTGAAAW
jgi:hypothetical protein